MQLLVSCLPSFQTGNLSAFEAAKAHNEFKSYKSRLASIDSKLLEKFASQIDSEENMLKLENLNNNYEIKFLMALFSGAAFIIASTTIGYYIGKYYDDLEKTKQANPDDKKDKKQKDPYIYQKKGFLLGGGIGILASLILYAYLTKLPNSL